MVASKKESYIQIIGSRGCYIRKVPIPAVSGSTEPDRLINRSGELHLSYGKARLICIFTA